VVHGITFRRRTRTYQKLIFLCATFFDLLPRIGYGLDIRDPRVRVASEAGKFSPHHRVQNGFGAHPFSYPMGTGGCFGSKAVGA